MSNAARHDRMLSRMTAHLRDAAGIQQGDAVLDVSCGCGATTPGAARLAGRGNAVRVDVSGVTVAEADRKAARDQAASARFVQADAQVHPFPAGGFDVVMSRLGMMFFDNPRAAPTSLCRALRLGGRLAFLAGVNPPRTSSSGLR